LVVAATAFAASPGSNWSLSLLVFIATIVLAIGIGLYNHSGLVFSLNQDYPGWFIHKPNNKA
jgi:hypothetical protein